jgi:hypothetical protein
MPEQHNVTPRHAVTMARMDRLFGVTMVEQAVSQLVSANLKRAEALVASRLKVVNHAALPLTPLRSLATEGGEEGERNRLSEVDGGHRSRNAADRHHPPSGRDIDLKTKKRCGVAAPQGLLLARSERTIIGCQNGAHSLPKSKGR